MGTIHSFLFIGSSLKIHYSLSKGTFSKTHSYYSHSASEYSLQSVLLMDTAGIERTSDKNLVSVERRKYRGTAWRRQSRLPGTRNTSQITVASDSATSAQAQGRLCVWGQHQHNNHIPLFTCRQFTDLSSHRLIPTHAHSRPAPWQFQELARTVGILCALMLCRTSRQVNIDRQSVCHIHRTLLCYFTMFVLYEVMYFFSRRLLSGAEPILHWFLFTRMKKSCSDSRKELSKLDLQVQSQIFHGFMDFINFEIGSDLFRLNHFKYKIIKDSDIGKHMYIVSTEDQKGSKTKDNKINGLW